MTGQALALMIGVLISLEFEIAAFSWTMKNQMGS